MNKSELIKRIAEGAEISNAAAGRALDTFVEAVTSTLVSGGDVRISDLGVFSVGTRAARSGRNPQTGEAIQLPESKVPKFKAAKALKDRLQ